MQEALQQSALADFTFQQEDITNVLPSILTFLKAHHDEVSPFPDLPISPNDEMYEKLEEIGALRVFTARKKGHS